MTPHSDPSTTAWASGCPAHEPTATAVATLYGPQFENDPGALYEKLRQLWGQVAPVKLEADIPAWLVLGYAENLEVLRDPRRFTRDSRAWRDLADGRIPPNWPLRPVLEPQPSALHRDGAEHRRLRGAITASLGHLNPRSVRRYVQFTADRLIDAFATDGRADLVRQYARPVPLWVMIGLFGLPADQGPQLADATTRMLDGDRPAEAFQYLRATLAAAIAAKRLRPGNDVLSSLIAHEAGLTDEEVLDQAWLTFTAALQVTAEWIANTILELLTDPAFHTSVSAGRLTVDAALERTLSTAPPSQNIVGRWATCDTQLAGRTIRTGDMLILCTAAAAADPKIDPERAVIDGTRSHLAWSTGPHRCPGEELAPIIARSAVDHLLRRLPGLRLAVPRSSLTWRTSIPVRGVTALPIAFTPAKPTA